MMHQDTKIVGSFKAEELKREKRTERTSYMEVVDVAFLVQIFFGLF